MVKISRKQLMRAYRRKSVVAAADELGISTTTLYMLLREAGISYKGCAGNSGRKKIVLIP